ncbi:CmcI family methyltransferase [uncultured Nostoc sp.]|uniref:CmcI family methyltransferase n=1 Tax=uncultured Nostoc sp. TaxID=340711 RepID=UPI0035CA1498
MSTQMDSRSVLQLAESQQEPLCFNRFVKISDREDKCDIPRSAWRPLTENYNLQTWKGIHLDKSPIEIALYPMLLYELQPKTIIELGALKGGSAIWLADQLDLFSIEGCVYSVDIDLSLLNNNARTDSRVEFLEGNCNNISAVLPPELLATLAHPWLVIEDTHVNLVGVLEYFHCNGLQSGDYLIVEDTNKVMWEEWADWDDKELLARVGRKLDELRTWLTNHQNEYLVDTYYQDMYGYNGSKNWNSILKRI